MNKLMLVVLAMLMCGACREETTERLDGGLYSHQADPVNPAATQPQVIYRDRDDRHDENSVFETYMQWHMLDSMFGSGSRTREVHHYSAPSVVHHETVIHHAPTPAPAYKPSASSWTTTKTTTTRPAASTSTYHSTPSSSPTHYSPPKSSSYGFKAPTRSWSSGSSSRPTSFRSSSSGRR